MPRFSAKAKEVWDTLTYHSDINKANKLLEELIDPLDIAFGKLFLEYYYIKFYQLEDFLKILTETDNENKKLKDQFIQFMINYYYCWYYIGHYNPIVSKEQAEKYLDKIEQSYQDIDYKDDWEKYYCFGWYYWIKAWYELKIKNAISNAIKFQEMGIEVWSKIPNDGKYYLSFGHNTLGVYYLNNGNFEEAENFLNRALNVFKQYNNLYQVWPLFNLANLNIIKGNIQKAKKFVMVRLDVAKRHNNIPGIFEDLNLKGSLLYYEGNYDEALKSHQESLVYQKQHGDPLTTFFGNFTIFNFYYSRYRFTKDKAFLTQAEEILTDLQELSRAQSDNKTMVSYTNYAQALIFKFGNIRKKSKAIDILEELIDAYPNNIRMSLNLSELLFEDFLLSEDPDTIDQIDELMGKINKIPLRNNPQAVQIFTSQQIFLSKYIYYIKGDISVALNILHNTTDHVKKFKLYNLEKILEQEIQILEKDIKKWENVDITIKERIKDSEFNKYIQEALKIANQQM